MALEGYKVKDYAVWVLDVGISSTAESLTLESWDWTKFPTYWAGDKSIASLISKDAEWVITKRERVTITWRSTDTLNITRGYNSDTSYSFSAGDEIAIFVHDWVVVDMQEAIESLETDKLDTTAFNTSLRTGLWADKILYTNGSGAETTLNIPANGSLFLAGDMTWKSASVDITGLTEETIASDDYLIFSDTSDSGNNKKINTENFKSDVNITWNFVAWESLSTWDSVYIDTSDWYIYKTDASDWSWVKTKFIWFAEKTVTATNNVNVIVNWISWLHSWLSVWEIYYLSDTVWQISNTPWTYKCQIWIALSSSHIRQWYTTFSEDQAEYGTGNTDNIQVAEVVTPIPYFWDETFIVSYTPPYAWTYRIEYESRWGSHSQCILRIKVNWVNQVSHYVDRYDYIAYTESVETDWSDIMFYWASNTNHSNHAVYLKNTYGKYDLWQIERPY